MHSWLVLPFTFLAARLLSIGLVYGIPAPGGGYVAERPWDFLLPALLAEVGCFAALTGLLGLATARLSHRARLFFGLAALVPAVAYAALGEIDGQVRRWMGLRLNLVFVRQFTRTMDDAGFWQTLAGYLAHDKLSVALSLLLVAWPTIAVVRSRRHLRRRTPWRTNLLLLSVGVASLALSSRRVPAVRKWRLVVPVPLGVAMDGLRDRKLRLAQEEPTPASLSAFRDLVGNAGGSDKHPAWRARGNDGVTGPPLPTRPADDLPDVFLFSIESLRGWVAHWESPAMRRRLPHLSALFSERGVAFVNAHSNGYPSGEGNMNLHLGVWSHPSRAIVSEHLSVRTRALPEILGDAGYDRTWLTGSDPGYDNLQHFLGRWFDRWQWCPGGDEALARRVIALYDAPTTAGPRFFSVYTSSTHPPYELPESERPTPADPEQAYMRALEYVDNAIGLVIEHVRRAGRIDRTVFVMAGDHAQPTAWHREHDDEVGLPNAGRTWTGLLIAAPGMKGGELRHDAVSHVDLPPTILGLAGIESSGHFYGRDLFRDPPRPVVAVFDGGLSVIEGEMMLIGALGGGPVRKIRYNEGPLPAPEWYRYGGPLPLQPSDELLFERARAAVGVHRWIMDEDRLRPR